MKDVELEDMYRQFCMNERTDIVEVLQFLEGKGLNSTGYYGFICYHQGRLDERNKQVNDKFDRLEYCPGCVHIKSRKCTHTACPSYERRNEVAI